MESAQPLRLPAGCSPRSLSGHPLVPSVATPPHNSCVPACPFGMIAINESDGRAWKCTLYYDRQKDGFEPACVKACPTQSILFGDLDGLRQRARERVGMLHERGITGAYLYGADEQTTVGDLNAFFLLVDKPEAYNLLDNPHLPLVS